MQVLEPADEASSVAYIAMLHYFGTKSRAGVVINLPGTVKVRLVRWWSFVSPSSSCCRLIGRSHVGGGDEQAMYVVPITSDDVHFRAMLRLEQDKLLMVVVTDKDFVQRP